MAKQADNFTPSHDEIAAQAYQIYLREGCVEGRDLDHWLRAEAELRERSFSGNGNTNGHAANGGMERAQSLDPRTTGPQEQGSVLPKSVTPASAAMTQITRSTTPRRSSGKREPAAAAK